MFFIWLFLDIENIKCSFFRPFCFLRTAQVFFIPKICLFEYTFYSFLEQTRDLRIVCQFLNIEKRLIKNTLYSQKKKNPDLRTPGVFKTRKSQKRE